MKRRKSDRGVLARAKNLVRGAVSVLHAPSTPDARRDSWHQEQVAQTQINRALALAKRGGSQREFVAFERWIGRFVNERTSSARQIGTHLTLLGLLPSELEADGLSSELLIAANRITIRTTELLNFAREAATLADLIEEGNWDGATAELETIKKHSGHSYWSIETELALTQSQKGIEAVKTKIGAMSICAIGLNKFFLYYFGVRNEPAQASARFRANLKKKIEDSDLPLDWQAYAKFRLYGHLDHTQRSLASVIACEQLTTTVDLLFTLIKITRLIVGQRQIFSEDVLEATRKAFEVLAPIVSLLKITPVNGKLDVQTSAIHQGDNLADLASAALRLAVFPQEHWPVGETSFRSKVIHGLASALSTRDDGLAGESFAKEVMNLNWLPLAIEMSNVSDLPSLPRLFLSAMQGSPNSLSIASVYGVLSRIVGEMVERRGEDSPDELKQVAAAVYGGRTGSIGIAIDGLRRTLAESQFGVCRDIAGVLLATLLQANDQLEESLAVSAQVGMENERVLAMLPLAELFQSVKWNSLRPFARSVDLPIALDHFLRVVDDRKIRTYKRYAIEELMKISGSNVSDLPSVLSADAVLSSKLEYLFSEVCDIATIELLPGMGDSRKVWQTRSQVLRELAKFHTRSELKYIREADEIDESLQVDDGLFVLDDSKIYVDEQAILNNLNQELAGDFQRYLKLVRSGMGVSDSLTDVLRSFRSPSAKTFQIPKNDADDLLAELVQTILDRFLFDPAFGLDIIVGRRIRHGTIASELRGYLERFNLIGYKAHAGADYTPPLAASTALACLEPKRRRIAVAAFSRFSESIDQIIGMLRDEYFHVRMPTKPRGIFDLSLTPMALALARSIAQTCQNIDQFSKECVAIFWIILSGRLDAQRPTIEGETKKTLHSILSKLTNELRSVDISDSALFAHIQQASDELQRRATIIASWVRAPKVSVEGKTYSLQYAVDVAGAMITGQRSGFFPIVTSDVPDSPQLEMHGFSIVVDALYIAFDNICEHSGKKADNHVKVEIQFEPNLSILAFTITNEVTPSSRTPEREARLSSTRSDIQKRAYGERARRDRGSGLAKLAALVMQSNKTAISFGYASNEEFQLKFDLVYLGPADALTPNTTDSLLQGFAVDIPR